MGTRSTIFKSTGPPVSLKPTEASPLEALDEISCKIKPESSEEEVAFLRRTEGGGVVVKLGLRTSGKGTFSEAVKVPA